MKTQWDYEVRRLNFSVVEGRNSGLTAKEILRAYGEDSERILSGQVSDRDPKGQLRPKMRDLLDGLCNKNNGSYYLVMAQKPNKQQGHKEDKVLYLFDPTTKKGYLSFSDFTLHPDIREFWNGIF